MLVLSRRKGESIVIGDDVRVTIERISGNRVRLGVEAAAEVIVDRAETRQRRRHGNLRIGSE